MIWKLCTTYTLFRRKCLHSRPVTNTYFYIAQENVSKSWKHWWLWNQGKPYFGLRVWAYFELNWFFMAVSLCSSLMLWAPPAQSTWHTPQWASISTWISFTTSLPLVYSYCTVWSKRMLRKVKKGNSVTEKYHGYQIENIV